MASKWWNKVSPNHPNLFVHLYLPFVVVFVVGELILIGVASNPATTQDPVLLWQWILLFFLFFGATTSFTNVPSKFYGGGAEFNEHDGDGSKSQRAKSLTALAMSTFISWVFAKSVYNASTLGAAYGWVGGLGYAMYYISFLSVALVIGEYRKQGFTSLPMILFAKYGGFSCFGFLLAVSYRLFNEVWSNSVVIGDFYGARQSGSWWAAVIVSTLIPMGYVMAGGMRMSLYSDVAQGIMAIIFIIIVLSVLGSHSTATELFNFNPVPARNMWSLEGGWDFFIVALLQGALSYPFFDPVLTDRAFLCSVPTMRIAFIIGGTVAAAYIFAFSFVGVYGAMIGVGGAPQKVSAALGPAVFQITALIMITSSMSTVDSTFVSTAKCWGLESVGLVTKGVPKSVFNAGYKDVLYGRVAIVIMAVIGTLPLVGDVVVLNATTISGTVVMGLGPPVILGLWFGPGARFCNYRLPLAFNMSFWCGVIFGICIQAGVKPSSFYIGQGSYGLLLGYNLYGGLICLGFYLLGVLIHAFILPKQVIDLSTMIGHKYYMDDESDTKVIDNDLPRASIDNHGETPPGEERKVVTI